MSKDNSNLKNINYVGRGNQTVPVDKKKKEKKDRVLVVYDEQHRMVKQEAFKTDREMREITSEAIDFYFKNR
ncbi:hypothetical protein GCM10022378_00170 [Salinicoccus jeotgali]|uniref:CopG family transcriptional regulator n=1 Tax=Salinicoccus jeotgali TaxID=381634 RepID=A0ABP7E3L4_9STAP